MRVITMGRALGTGTGGSISGKALSVMAGLLLLGAGLTSCAESVDDRDTDRMQQCNDMEGRYSSEGDHWKCEGER